MAIDLHSCQVRIGTGLTLDWHWIGTRLGKDRLSRPTQDWQRIGTGLALDWHRIDTGLALDWQRIGTGLAKNQLSPIDELLATDWRRIGTGPRPGG